MSAIHLHVQIFEFLDVDGLGSIDLVATISSAPEWLDDLDDEVRGGLAVEKHSRPRRMQRCKQQMTIEEGSCE